jgi:hypothetical protein
MRARQYLQLSLSVEMEDRIFMQVAREQRTLFAFDRNRYNDGVHHQRWFQRLFQPGRSRSIPHARAWNIALRTVHLMTTSMFVGGYVFGASSVQLRPLLHVSIATGVGLALVETYPSLHFIFEGWGLFLLAKLALLHFVVTAQSHRIPIILAVVGLAGVGSHMPGKLRHYSVLERKVVDP